MKNNKGTKLYLNTVLLIVIGEKMKYFRRCISISFFKLKPNNLIKTFNYMLIKLIKITYTVKSDKPSI
jgi:hypothetical protein